MARLRAVGGSESTQQGSSCVATGTLEAPMSRCPAVAHHRRAPCAQAASPALVPAAGRQLLHPTAGKTPPKCPRAQGQRAAALVRGRHCSSLPLRSRDWSISIDPMARYVTSTASQDHRRFLKKILSRWDLSNARVVLSTAVIALLRGGTRGAPVVARWGLVSTGAEQWGRCQEGKRVRSVSAPPRPLTVPVSTFLCRHLLGTANAYLSHDRPGSRSRALIPGKVGGRAHGRVFFTAGS